LLGISKTALCYRISYLHVDEIGRSRMPYSRQILLSNDPVPRRSVIFLSGFAHLAVLLLIFALRHAGPYVVPEKIQAVQKLSGSSHLAFNPAQAKAGRPNAALHLPRKTRHARPAQQTGEGGTALEVLREHARTATAGMVASIKVRQFYGFSTDQYDLAVRTSGELPVIPASDLPPRFEQYVTVEITIDLDGRVADARIISGEAPPAVQQRLLSAVREFKYTPARRNGTPIPTQVDVVVHIPS
jgi:TonB family protein